MQMRNDTNQKWKWDLLLRHRQCASRISNQCMRESSERRLPIFNAIKLQL